MIAVWVVGCLVVGFIAGNVYTALYLREIMIHACRANYLDGYTDAYEGSQINPRVKDPHMYPDGGTIRRTS